MLAPTDFISELVRLEHGPKDTDQIPGIGTVRFIVKCNADAADVLAIAKTTMTVVSRVCANGWDESLNLETLLPKRFVQACAADMTRSEADAWLAHWQQLSPEARAQEEKSRVWSLANWLHWMSPSERTWLWWDAVILDKNYVVVAVAVEEWPFPWGALSWLFRGCGALEVSPES